MATNGIIQEIMSSGKKGGKYYDPVPSEIPKATRRLFEEYAGVPPDEVIPYLVELRDKLWFIYPWPCVGQFKFASLTLHRQPAYPRIVAAIKAGARYLDLGCAVGQDMRYLVLDGCPSTNMFGLDRAGGYIEAAYDSFHDREALKTRFIVADLMDRSVAEVRDALCGKVDIVHAAMLVHCWDLDGQIAVCERIVELLKPEPGALAVGNSVGRRVAAPWPGPEGTTIYKHNLESFTAMWEEVGRRTGTRWKVSGWNDDQVGLNPWDTKHWEDPMTTTLFWCVERL